MKDDLKVIDKTFLLTDLTIGQGSRTRSILANQFNVKENPLPKENNLTFEQLKANRILELVGMSLKGAEVDILCEPERKIREIRNNIAEIIKEPNKQGKIF